MKEKDINGVKLYIETNSVMHRFCIGVYIKAGCMYEPDEINGITHLFEHMVFRNIKSKYETDFYELLTYNGITFEASTYKEFLCFTISGLPKGIKLAAEILSSLFDDIKLKKDDFISEKNRVKAEIRENCEKQTLSYFADKEVWGETSLANTITGTCKNIDAISQKKINDYKNSVLSFDNVFIYITGNVNSSDMAQIENAVSLMKISDIRLDRANFAPIPTNFMHREYCVISKYASYYRVRISFDIDNSVCPVEVRDIIYAILFENDDALIFQELSENNPLVYSYDSVFEQYNNISCLKLEYEVSKRNLSESLKVVLKVLNSLKNGEFNFKNNLQKLLTKWEILQDDIYDLNWCLAYENQILGNCAIDYSKDKFGRFSSLTKEQVMECAKKIFKSSNLTVALKGDKKYIQSLNLTEIIKEFDN